MTASAAASGAAPPVMSLETVTRDYLRRELEELTDLMHRIEDKLEDTRHDEASLQDPPQADDRQR